MLCGVVPDIYISTLNCYYCNIPSNSKEQLWSQINIYAKEP